MQQWVFLNQEKPVTLPVFPLELLVQHTGQLQNSLLNPLQSWEFRCTMETNTCVLLMQFILGFLAFAYPTFSKNKREQLAPYHQFLGRATFVMGLATMAVSNPVPLPNTHWECHIELTLPGQIFGDLWR